MPDNAIVIAILQMVTQNSPFRYERFAKIARSVGCAIEYPNFGDGSLEGAKRAWGRAEELLRSADAFVVDGLPIEQVSWLADLFHQRIDAGARAFVIPRSTTQEDIQNSALFLGRYYMEPSWLKIVTPIGRPFGVRFRREEDSLLSEELFSNVNEVIVDSPFAIKCWGEAFPVMVAGKGARGVDLLTDYPNDWNGRELACMGQWVGYGNSSVLVAHARGLISDPTDVMAGHLPGIENNQLLAENIARFLAHAQPVRRTSPSKPAPEDLCKRIEINLCDFVLGIVKSAEQDWWNDTVPLDVRQKVRKRQEEERSRFPKEAYFDVLDLKEIMRQNWTVFEPHFTKAERKGGKDKVLGFVDKLNKLRRLTGHPLKLHVSGYTFSAEECAFLEETDTLMLKLAAPFTKRAPGTD